MAELNLASVAAGLQASATDDFVRPADVREQLSTLPEHLPRPTGYYILVMALTIPETVGEAGIIVIDSSREAQAVSSPQGIVLELGPEAYQAEGKFESGPWCKRGDRVLFQKYAGRTFRLANGQLLFLLNDDDIIAVVDDGWLDGEEEK